MSIFWDDIKIEDNEELLVRIPFRDPKEWCDGSDGALWYKMFIYNNDDDNYRQIPVLYEDLMYFKKHIVCVDEINFPKVIFHTDMDHIFMKDRYIAIVSDFGAAYRFSIKKDQDV